MAPSSRPCRTVVSLWLCMVSMRIQVHGFAATTTKTTTSRRIRQATSPRIRNRCFDQQRIRHPERTKDFVQYQKIQHCRFSSLDDFLEGGDFDRLLQQQVENSQKTGVDTDQPPSGWRKIPWDNPFSKEDSTSSSAIDDVDTNISTLPPSPVEQRTIEGRQIWIKRDDLLKLPNSGISGNKARKMWTLDQIPPKDFPACIVSYGGPQSNSMLALAAIVNSKNRMRAEDEDSSQDQHKHKRFVYYTKTLPRFLRNQPNGNLFRALSLGMELKELTPAEYNNLFEEHDQLGGDAPDGLAPPIPGNSVWVPQGGAFAAAHAGTLRLAREIFDFWKEQGRNQAALTVCVPGGTCTTALLLHHGLKRLKAEHEQSSEDVDVDIEVVVIPCVGDEAYARRQMMSLSVQIGEEAEDIPTVLLPCPEQSSDSSQKYFTFGKPEKEILETFQELQRENLVVDLIYGAPSFAILLRHLRGDSDLLGMNVLFDPFYPFDGREIMHVHSGGLEGINSQLLRYKYEGMVEIEDVQLPGKAGKK